MIKLKKVGLAAVLALIAWGVVGCSPPVPEHGVAFVLAVDRGEGADAALVSNQLRHAEAAIRKRIPKIFDLPSLIERVQSDRLLVKLPDLKPEKLDVVRRLLTERGLLEFCMAHTNSADLVAQGTVPPGYRLLKQEQTTRFSDEKTVMPWLIRTAPERGLTSRYLRQVWVTENQITGEAEIQFELNREGADLFAQVTTEFRPNGNQVFHLGLVFDGILYSVPRINGPITGGRAMLTGDFKPLEGSVVAAILELPLETRLRIVEERTF